ncbi:MAG: sulfatase [Ruthenibacterium sp.]
MRVLLFDIDTLRSDHLGCYGYGRNTSPTMDAVAGEGVRFTDYYCPNAPCLPARASLVTGQYGIHNGVLGHGGTAADLRLQGATRSFTDDCSENGLFMQFRRAGMHTVSFSSFAERHAAWWFNAGFNECYNVGKRGGESAEMITPQVLDWLSRNGEQDNWMLHVHYWDPHTPYRTPADYESCFTQQPLSDDWIDDAVFAQHQLQIGPHGVHEINMWNDDTFAQWPKHPGKLETRADAKHFMDLYDDGVRFTDDNIAQILALLKQKNLYNDDLAILITSDHGEDLGELGLYGEHGLADEPVCHIPMIIKWPGAQKGAVASGFYDNVDLLPTVQELLQVKPTGGQYHLDGISYAKTLLTGESCARRYSVLTQCAHVCQRSVRFDHYIYIRTIHGGYHLFPREMLFDIVNDPHEQHNLADKFPALCAKGAKIILDWTEDMLKTSQSDTDPLWTVMREGGPEHCRGHLQSYMERIAGTPRAYGIPLLKQQYPNE